MSSLKTEWNSQDTILEIVVIMRRDLEVL